MAENSYLPGKALVLSRLPAKEWFTVDEAAAHSGWSESFIRGQVAKGELPGQKYQSGKKARKTHYTYRIHIDDLCLFIIRNGNGKYTEEKPFRDVVSIIRSWPKWMIRELQKVINRLVPLPESEKKE